MTSHSWRDGSAATGDESRVRDHHDQEVEKWSRYYDALPLVEEDAHLASFNREFVGLVQGLLPLGGDILEAGSGGGWQSLALAGTGRFRVTLLDFSPPALRYARRVFERRTQQARFELGDIFEPAEPRYDLVFNLGALEHYDLDDQEKFLRGMASRSRRYVLVVVPNLQCYWYWLWRLEKQVGGEWPFGYEAPTTDLSHVFERAGLCYVGRRWIGASWTEGLVEQIHGLEDGLRGRILQVHRSELIPDFQKAYLMAALGVVGESKVPESWDQGREPQADRIAVVSSELSSRLAENLGQQKRLREMERQVRRSTAERDHFRRQAAELQNRLDEISRSRLWRVGHLYWSIRRRLSRKPALLVRQLLHRASSALGSRTAAKKLSAAPGQGRYDVIIFPIIDWDFRIQRPQQILRRFAENGHRGYYLGTRLTGKTRGLELRDLGEHLVSVGLPGSASVDLYQDTARENLIELWLEALEELRRRARIEQAICLVQFPFWGPLAIAARRRWGWKVVYDCMDEHSGFVTTGKASRIREEELVEEADLVIATSQVLHDKVSPRARRSVLLRNASDFDHFHRAAEAVGGLVANDEVPVIGYYGAISDWFDVGLLERAALDRRHWRFVLVGSTFGADVSSLAELDNVSLIGEMPYERLPDQLQEFDVALIPFRLTPLTLATNPVKFYEYLSAGKPVVAVRLPELEDMRELFYSYEHADEFVPAIEAALVERDPELRNRRIELARKNTWAARVRVLDREVRQLYGKAVVIIVSFGNLDYLRICLESIQRKTVYPRYEVVVVDNGSEAAVQEWLCEQARTQDWLRVVLNEENLGFPRANNIGIQASGDADYVVLLNDDTVVTRGWLSRLVGHLETEPELGLVGAVTNWAGNEAKIEVGYRDVRGMEAFAHRYTEAHRGEVVDIPMVPLFCAALPAALLSEIGPLDEQFGIGMFEDDDLSKRVRLVGRRVACAHDVFVHHWGRSSFGRMDKTTYRTLFEENRRKFEEKWGEPWEPHRHG